MFSGNILTYSEKTTLVISPFYLSLRFSHWQIFIYLYLSLHIYIFFTFALITKTEKGWQILAYSRQACKLSGLLKLARNCNCNFCCNWKTKLMCEQEVLLPFLSGLGRIAGPWPHHPLLRKSIWLWRQPVITLVLFYFCYFQGSETLRDVKTWEML